MWTLRPSLCSPVVLAAVFVSSLCLLADAACRIRLSVDPELSLLTFSGRSYLGVLQAPIAVRPNIVSGYTGGLYLDVNTTGNSTSCPTTQQEWVASIPNFSFSTVPSPYIYQWLQLYPNVLPALIANTASQQFNLSYMGFNVSSVAPVVAGANGTLSTSFFSQILQGTVYTSSVITGQSLDTLVGYTSSMNATAQLSVSSTNSNATQLMLDFPNWNWTFTTYSNNSALASLGMSGIAVLNFQGRLVLKALLGCPEYCGDHGLCAEDEDSAFYCQCECGWAADSTGACNTAVGYCPLYPVNVTQSTPTPPQSPLSNDTNSSCTCDGNSSSAHSPPTQPAEALCAIATNGA